MGLQQFGLCILGLLLNCQSTLVLPEYESWARLCCPCLGRARLGFPTAPQRLWCAQCMQHTSLFAKLHVYPFFDSARLALAAWLMLVAVCCMTHPVGVFC
jgi:hypothetical protein